MAGILGRLTRRGPPVPPEEPPGTLELRGTGTRVVFVPAVGGRITTLELGGREWLRPGGAIEEGVGAAGDGREPPLRGEVAVETRPDGNAATHAWRDPDGGWRLERRVRVAPTGEVEMRYTATAEGASRVPFLWTAAALLPLTAATRLLVTEGTPVRVGDAQGVALGARGAEHRWPHARLEKSIADLSRPARVARKYAAELWLAMKDGRIGVEENDLRLELAFDAGDVPVVRLHVNHKGVRLGDERAPAALSLGVATGLPESLGGAGPQGAARPLERGERRTWTLTWSAHPVGPASPGR